MSSLGLPSFSDSDARERSASSPNLATPTLSPESCRGSSLGAVVGGGGVVAGAGAVVGGELVVGGSVGGGAVAGAEVLGAEVVERRAVVAEMEVVVEASRYRSPSA